MHFINSDDDTSPLHRKSLQDMISILHSPKSTKDWAGHAMVKVAPALLGLLVPHGGHTNHVLSQDGGRDQIMTVLE